MAKNTCPSCQSTEFSLIDGTHYCDFCGTASQALGTQHEHTDDYQLPAQCLSLLHKVSTKTPKPLKNTDKPTTNKKDYRPWNIDEGYQFVLMEQAKALVKLGAHESLPEVVFRVWALFLKKSGKAFLDKKLTSEQLRRKQFLLNKLRDKFPGTLKDPQIKQVSFYASSTSTWFEKRNKLAKLELEAQIGEQEKAESEDETDEAHTENKYCGFIRKHIRKPPNQKIYYGSKEHRKLMDDDEKRIVKMIDQEIEYKKVFKKKTEVKVDVDEDGNPTIEKMKDLDKPKLVAYMCMSKTLAIVYLALHLLNSSVLVCDLLRWVHDGLVPYVSFPNWPEDMKLFNQDIKTFSCSKIPTSEQLFHQINQIMYYLDLNVFPQLDITTICARFVHELGLPSETNAMIANLLELKRPFVKLQPKIRHNFSTNPALLAMSYVVFVLKMLFRLDDSAEWTLSDYTNYLSDNIHFDKPLFNWREWVIYCERKSIQDDIVHEAPNMNNVMHIRDLSGTLAKYQSLYDTDPLSTNATAQGKFYVRKVEFMKNYHRLFSNMSKKIKQPDGDEEPEYDFDRINNDLINGAENSNRNDHHRDRVPRRKFKKSPFVGCTYAHIMHYRRFREAVVKNDSVAAKTSTGDNAAKKSPATANQSFESNDMIVNCQSLNPARTLEDVISEIPGDLKVIPEPWKKYLVFSHEDYVNGSSIFLDKHSYNFISEKASNDTKDQPNRRGLPISCFNLKKPHSFEWLLNLCSKHILTTTVSLQKIVKRLELLLLDELKDEQFNKTFMKNLFRKICFKDNGRKTSSKRKASTIPVKNSKTSVYLRDIKYGDGEDDDSEIEDSKNEDSENDDDDNTKDGNKNKKVGNNNKEVNLSDDDEDDDHGIKEDDIHVEDDDEMDYDIEVDEIEDNDGDNINDTIGVKENYIGGGIGSDVDDQGDYIVIDIDDDVCDTGD